MLANNEDIITAVEKIRRIEEKIREISSVLRKQKEFILNVKPFSLEKLKVIGVDGSIVSKRCYGLDLALISAMAAIFEYCSGKLVKTKFYPSPPFKKLVTYTQPILEDKLSLSLSYHRQLTELKVAYNVLKNEKPDFLILDGSLYLKENLLESFPKYSEIYNLFIKICEICKNRGIYLVGVVKDSRCAKFVQDIAKVTGEKLNIRDVSLLYNLLREGERTTTFKLNPSQNILSFYLKVSEYDKPLRVDFLAVDGDSQLACTVASVIYFLSSFNKTFGYPAVLLEADARVRLSKDDIEAVYYELLKKLGGASTLLLSLKREDKLLLC